MNKHYLKLVLLGCFPIFCTPKVSACGYDWISDCSSQLHLRINGVLDSFNLAGCPSGHPLDGIQLGSLQSLSLANAKTITWESCQNNVSAVQLRYRVYEQSFPGSNWMSINLLEYHQTIEGPYTTRYRQLPVNISLTSGLTIGKTYILEVYLVAEADTIGDDFIPETTFFRNNNGANYQLTFTYGGAAAPPLALLPHLTEPACNGGSNGNIAISTYGDLTGLFFQWSNINLNFYQQYGLPSGAYGVTVTNGVGHSASVAMQLGQPAILQTNFTNIQSVGCNNSPGAATVTPAGGTAPYQYFWENGQQTPAAILPYSANWKVTVTDAHQCTATGSVFISNTGQVERAVSASICSGQTYSLSGQYFTASGVYHFTTPGAGGCDTLTHLTLQVLNPAELLQQLPDVITISCAIPAINLCALTFPDATYTWSKDGIPVNNTPCLLATAGGNYLLQVTEQACVAMKVIQATEHLSVAPASISGQIEYQCDNLQPGWLIAHTDAINPSFLWTYSGNILSVDDSCFFLVTEFQGGNPVLPTLLVTDSYGCQNGMPDNNTVIIPPHPMALQTAATNASSSTAGDGSASVQVSGGTLPFHFTWSTGDTVAMVTNLVPGTYCVTVLDGSSCTSTACVTVSYAVSATAVPDQMLPVFPNPASAGSLVNVMLPPQFCDRRVQIEFVDMDGKVVCMEKYSPGSNSQIQVKIPENTLPGILMIRVRREKATLIGKILVR